MRSFSNYLFENMLAFISRTPSVSPWRAYFHLELFINHERGLLRSHGGPASKCQWRQTGVQLVTWLRCLDGPRSLHAHPRSLLFEILRLHSSVYSSASQPVCILPSREIFSKDWWHYWLSQRGRTCYWHVVVRDEGYC